MADGKIENSSKREFLQFSGKAGLSTMVATAAGVNLGLVDLVHAQPGKKVTPFRFAVISDSHLYSFKDHKFDTQLMDAIEQVNNLPVKPDFVLYGGDIAQDGTMDQLEKGKKILSNIKSKMVIIPGEHDWYVDMGTGWNGLYGANNPESGQRKGRKEYWSFDHKGVHFVGLNNILVDDFWTAQKMTGVERQTHMSMLEGPWGGLWGIHAEQLAWLKKDLAKQSTDTPIVLFSHAPLWDYYPRWGFGTSDGAEIRAMLARFENTFSFHGHVHQTIYNKIGNMSSVGAMSTSWPWPYPDVELTFPQSRQYRADPGNEADGMGSYYADITPAGINVQHQPFADSLTPWMKNGFKA